MSGILSMAAFALASSISPGPVNLVALGAGARYGLRPSMQHVTGATLGFTLLLLLTGLGLYELMRQWPQLTDAVRWAGIAFLFFMAYKLVSDDGTLDAGGPAQSPSFMYGAAMQWLNPKAWLAALAGMGAYAIDGNRMVVWQFTAIYFVICYGSIACWALAGSMLRKYLHEPRHVRLLNRLMAAFIAVSAAGLLAA